MHYARKINHHLMSMVASDRAESRLQSAYSILGFVYEMEDGILKATRESDNPIAADPPRKPVVTRHPDGTAVVDLRPVLGTMPADADPPDGG